MLILLNEILLQCSLYWNWFWAPWNFIWQYICIPCPELKELPGINVQGIESIKELFEVVFILFVLDKVFYYLRGRHLPFITQYFSPIELIEEYFDTETTRSAQYASKGIKARFDFFTKKEIHLDQIAQLRPVKLLWSKPCLRNYSERIYSIISCPQKIGQFENIQLECAPLFKEKIPKSFYDLYLRINCRWIKMSRCLIEVEKCNWPQQDQYEFIVSVFCIIPFRLARFYSYTRLWKASDKNILRFLRMFIPAVCNGFTHAGSKIIVARESLLNRDLKSLMNLKVNDACS